MTSAARVVATLVASSWLVAHPPRLDAVSVRRQALHVRAAVRMEADEALYRPPPIDESALSVGQVVTGTVLQKQKAGYAVDIGTARSGFVPRAHVALRPNLTLGRREIGQGWAELPAGWVFEAQVLGIGERGVNVSIARVEKTIAWQRVGMLAAEDITLVAPILRYDEKGVTLDVEGLPAYLPWSHWALPVEERVPSLIGRELAIKFLEVDRIRARLVVSHRRVKLDEALAAIEPGGVVDGVVTSVRDYGGVVSLLNGRVDGLLHVSQISQVFVRNVSEVLSVGMPIRCVVLNVDTVDGDISLSTKMLESTPGEIIKNASAVFARAAGKTAQESGTGAAQEPAAAES